MRGHTANGAKYRGRAGGLNAMVAAGGGGSVGAVAVVIAHRVELPGALGIDARIATSGFVEILGADQLLVAHRSIKFLTGGALAVPTGDLLVAQLAILGPIAVEIG